MAKQVKPNSENSAAKPPLTEKELVKKLKPRSPLKKFDDFTYEVSLNLASSDELKDMAATQRPSYEGDIALDGAFWDSGSHQRIWHKGDVWPGQSGGPFFAWWAGESWPRVVAVQSGQNTDENSASGGGRMVELINKARNEHP